MIKSTFVVASLATLALASNVAFAEGEEPAGEPAADAPAEPTAEPTSEPAAEPTAEAAPAGGRHITGDFINGSLTVAKGKIVAGLGIGIGLKDPFPIALTNDGTGGIPGSSQGLWARYGVTDKIDVGAGYSFALKDFEIKGDLQVTAGYQALSGSAGGKLDLAARVNIGYNVLGEKLDPIGLGADLRYRLSDKMALFSSNQLVIGIAEQEIVAGPATITIKDGKYLQLPIGFAFSVNPKLAVHASTNLAIIEIADSATGFIGADFLPLNLGAMYGVSDKLTVGGALTWADLKDNADVLGLAIAARFAM
ncbi:MAG TPA: hypothetical protein PLF40_08555 [Kofleriaceae bacterium]|nr:hypothetical protein [Kofleriaceae bacterium]